MPPLLNRLLPAARTGGFHLQDQWVWGGSPIRGDDGRYHLFASCWTKSIRFAPHWLTNSRIVRAVADTPEGPYELCEEVLGPRDPQMWDGRMAHNPTIHRWRDKYLLFYTGTTYVGLTPDSDHQLEIGHPQALEARANQRIGMVVASSLTGPWQRYDQPILDPRPGHWDAFMTANPAACVHEDGSILLYYKSTTDASGKLMYGVACASAWDAPFERAVNDPVFDFSSGAHIEDAYVWQEEDQYRMVFKDMTDILTGEYHAGAEAHSADGISWSLANSPKAYSRSVRWGDGTTSVQGALERPQVLVERGRPTHIFFATANGPGRVRHATDTWNMVIPLG